MPLITKEDLSTHLYGSVIDEITRDNDALVTKAIASAEAEVKMYLTRYDVAKLFTLPIPDDFLSEIVKDIACWKLVKLANPGVNMELFRTMYEDAIRSLGKIQSGTADPVGWPYADDDPDTSFIEGGIIQSTSNFKRSQHY